MQLSVDAFANFKVIADTPTKVLAGFLEQVSIHTRPVSLDFIHSDQGWLQACTHTLVAVYGRMLFPPVPVCCRVGWRPDGTWEAQERMPGGGHGMFGIAEELSRYLVQRPLLVDGAPPIVKAEVLALQASWREAINAYDWNAWCDGLPKLTCPEPTAEYLGRRHFGKMLILRADKPSLHIGRWGDQSLIVSTDGIQVLHGDAGEVCAEMEKRLLPLLTEALEL